MKKILILSMAAFLVFGFTSWASADYSFTYLSNDNSVNISGMLYTSSNGAGPLQITGGSLGSATLLTGTGIAPSASEYPGLRDDINPFRYDNQLSPGAVPMLTQYGLLFSEGTFRENLGYGVGAYYKEINIWSDSPSSDYSYAVAHWTDTEFSWDRYEGTLTLTATAAPVPAAVWLLGTGLVGLFGVRRRFTKS
jgi:hypothetical protein